MNKLGRNLKVAIATAGCTSCIVGGAVDPAPPPLQCEATAKGELLYAYGGLSGSKLDVKITSEAAGLASWADFEVSNLVGAELGEVQLAGSTIELLNPSDSGRFTVRGTLVGRAADGSTLRCPVSRTFTFTMVDRAHNHYEFARAVPAQLPLGARHAAAINVIRRDGDLVELEARSDYPGQKQPVWIVSAGEIVGRVLDRALWRIPQEPGLYQIQLALDYGDDGLAFDAVTFEVA